MERQHKLPVSHTLARGGHSMLHSVGRTTSWVCVDHRSSIRTDYMWWLYRLLIPVLVNQWGRQSTYRGWRILPIILSSLGGTSQPLLNSVIYSFLPLTNVIKCLLLKTLLIFSTVFLVSFLCYHYMLWVKPEVEWPDTREEHTSEK